MIVITLARKPLDAPTVCENVMSWGTGALNIDGGRISVSGAPKQKFPEGSDYAQVGYGHGTGTVRCSGTEHLGRWPANFILEHSPECLRLGKTLMPVRGNRECVVGTQSDGFIQFNHKPVGYKKKGYTSPDGTEWVDAWECVPACPVKDLGTQSGVRPVSGAARKGAESAYMQTGAVFAHQRLFGYISGGDPATFPNDSGTAARFFKQVQTDERQK